MSFTFPSHADTTLTHRNLSTVLNDVNTGTLEKCLNIPFGVEEKIRQHSKNEEQQRDECVYYWKNISPYSLIGWSFLGGQLYWLEQEAALRAAKEYIQRDPGTYGCDMCVHVCRHNSFYDT